MFCFLQKFKIKMSFFGKLFGKASDKDTVTTGEAIQKLRETEEMLMKKEVSVMIIFRQINIDIVCVYRNF